MKKLLEGIYGKIALTCLLLLVISGFAVLSIAAEDETGTPVTVVILDIDQEAMELSRYYFLGGMTPLSAPSLVVENKEEIKPVVEKKILPEIMPIVDLVPNTMEDEWGEEDSQQETPIGQVEGESQPQVPQEEAKQEEDQQQSNETENKEEVEVIRDERLERLMAEDLNGYVLDVIKTYPLSRYPYLLNNDYQNYNGVTVNISYKNQRLLKAHPSGNRASHCSGITFEVFFKAMQQRNKQVGISPDDFNGMSFNQLNNFVLAWYVANGSKKNSNIAVAIEKYGIGKSINNFEEAKAGDFLDFSRENNTGHTVVFLNWIRDNGKIVGLRYWSSQQSTKGINYVEEYFNVRKSNGSKYGNVMIDQVYIGRVTSIKQYK